MLAIPVLEVLYPALLIVPLVALARKASPTPEPLPGIVQITSRDVVPRRNWIHAGLIACSLVFFIENILLLTLHEPAQVHGREKILNWVFLETGAVAYALAATICAVRDRYRGRALLWLLILSFAVEAARYGLVLWHQLTNNRPFLPAIIIPPIRLVSYIATIIFIASPKIIFTTHIQSEHASERTGLLSETDREQSYGGMASQDEVEGVQGYIVPGDREPEPMQPIAVYQSGGDPAKLSQPVVCAPSLNHHHPTFLNQHTTKQNIRPRSVSPSSSSPSPPPLSYSEFTPSVPMAQREKRRSFNVHRTRPPSQLVFRSGGSGGSSEGKAAKERSQVASTPYQASASSQGHGGSGTDSDSSDATEVERETKKLLDGLRAQQIDDSRRRKSAASAPVPPSGSPGPLRHQPYHVRRPPQLLHPLPARITLLPIVIRLPSGSITITRRRGEDCLIIGAITGAIAKLGPGMREWAVAGEMSLLVILSLIYVSLRSSKAVDTRPMSPPLVPRQQRPSFSHTSTPSPDGRAAVDPPGSRGRVWGTDEKDYRDCPDDGAYTALLLGPLLAASLLVSTIERKTSGVTALPSDWMVERPLVVPSTPIYNPGNPTSREPGGDALSALAFSRRNLVQLTTLLSFVLLVQVMWSRRAELRFRRQRRSDNSSWIPKREWGRTATVVVFAFVVTSGCVVVKAATKAIGGAIWTDMSFSDVVIASLFYQFSLYVCVRLARRGFTLGELGIVCHAATTLFMETVNVTRNKIRILQTPYIKTYRLPTPLLFFQLALIPGSLLAGFLLSPLLILARNIAQKPVHRLRYPREKDIHRRALAAGFYIGAAIVCVGIVGTWVQWCLEWRNPWMWVIKWLLQGQKPWTRPVLIAYWGLLAAISVAGWTRQLARARRLRPRNPISAASADRPAPVGAQNLQTVATQVMDAADQRLPTLSVNARRKYFHALAVVMFVPGIAFDPAFTHLSFSLAFAAFTFAEYVRYFALYPFGASVHLFLNEFLDHKDSGTAILSHFYLLTGCAGPLWLESSSQIMSYFGVLSLGIGDALASVVGRRMGRARWSSANGKTIEGSVAFAATVLLSSFGLWAGGLVANFNPWAYTSMVILTSVLEALSAQNDNLILPLYGWCVGTLLGV